MRYLYQLLFAVVITGLMAASANAQQQGGGGQGGGGQGGGGQGGGGQGGGGQGGGGQGGGGDIGGTTLTQLESAPNITAPGTTGGGGSSVINTSNVFATTFGNPYYQGTPTNAKSSAAPGGFGSTLYPTSAGNAARARGGAAGTRGGAGNTANQFGTIISLPIQVSYPAVARFPAAPMTATKLQSDLSGLIGRSTMIANPAGIQVLADGGTVTLRGTAKDADEARVIAGMVRMTPGVRAVVNELNFPQQ